MKINKRDVFIAVLGTIIIVTLFSTMGNTSYYRFYLDGFYGFKWWPRVLVATILTSIIIPRLLKQTKYAEFSTMPLACINAIILISTVAIEARAGVAKLIDSVNYFDGGIVFIFLCAFSIVLVPAIYYLIGMFFLNIEENTKKFIRIIATRIWKAIVLVVQIIWVAKRLRKTA